MVRRAIKIEGIDKVFEISKVSGVNVPPVGGFLMHLDQLKDGTVRLLYNSNVIPDLTKGPGITFIREE